jgi:cellulose 1,4-beta-cellobiosidase
MSRALLLSASFWVVAACAHPTGEPTDDADTANEAVHSKGGSGGAGGRGGSAGQAGQKPASVAGSAGKPSTGGGGSGGNHAGGKGGVANDAGDSATEPSGGDAGQTGPGPSAAAGELSLQYQAGNIDPADNQVGPRLRIVSQAKQGLDLSTLKARYYFSSEPAPPLLVELYNAFADGTSGYRALPGGSVVVTAKAGYAELTFTPAAGLLDAGGHVTIEAAFHDTGWNGKFDETNDYSFDAAHTTYAAWDHVTLYQGGQLVSGIEPP